MRFSRDVTGIPVIHAESGKELGRVREWLLDSKGESVLAVVAESLGWLSQARVFPFRQVAGIGDDAVLVSYDEAEPPPDLDISEGDTRNILGKRVLTTSGREVGVVEDVLFDENSGMVTGWRLSSGLIEDLLSGRRVLESQIPLTMGEDVLIIHD